MTQITLSDLFSHKHNPYPFYARLREQGPLSHFAWRGEEMWLVTTYDDTVAILKDPRFTLDKQKVVPSEGGQGSIGEFDDLVSHSCRRGRFDVLSSL